tara:strand:- start:72 stop:515 length:444 start_codon:yes stop_codon:yes gene_type:complete
MEEQEQEPVSPAGLIIVGISLIALAGAFWIANEKTERAVKHFAGISVREKAALNYPKHLEREVSKLEAKLTTLRAEQGPLNRETRTEKNERWEDDKFHLQEQLRIYEIELQEKAAELDLLRAQIPPELYLASDAKILAEIANREVAQ